jgi:DNA-binding NarL/FixJ family response regulator
MIVDDNAQFLEAAAELLQREGIDVVGVASTIAEALQQAGELRPDVYLVDLDLGGESGFDLAQRLGAVERSARLSPSTVGATAGANEPPGRRSPPAPVGGRQGCRVAGASTGCC